MSVSFGFILEAVFERAQSPALTHRHIHTQMHATYAYIT